MSQSPVICFGQQPCGFFPKRFLYAKIKTARRMQSEMGGEIVFFFHDSDHDHRETKTILRHRKNNEPLLLNFAFKNKTQRKFSPLNLKEIAAGWQERTAQQLPPFVDGKWVEAFQQAKAGNVADFCLEMYRRMGLLEGVKVVRSSDPNLRRSACEISEFFVDVPYEGEIVRARLLDGTLKLHEGGDSYIDLPHMDFSREQVSPTRDSRFKWMQSIVHCTHYVTGAGESAYIRREDAPEINCVNRDEIERSDEAYTDVTG